MSAVVQSGADSYQVHLGFWTNWSYGRVEGATITLTKANGGLLIAFIAIFVGATGKSFWRIACFVMHRIFSSTAPQDALYHQRQAVLRNVNTAQDAAWTLGNAMLMWRRRARQPFRRLLPIIIFALLVSASFGIAGIFSSHITTDTANEVLIRGDNCGPLDSSDSTDPMGYVTLFEPYQNQRVIAYSNYALRCYTNTSNSEDCNLYIKPKLSTSVFPNASCPFDHKMCKSQSANLIVDTGYLNSHEHLGINAAPENRFDVRLVHHCAPIVTEGFSELYNGSSQPIMRYNYGELNSGGGRNYSYEMPVNYSISNVEGYTFRGSARADYSIGLLKAYGGDKEMSQENSMFNPIPELWRADSDVMLFFLSAQGITFSQPVDDLWYSSHKSGPPRVNSLTNFTRPSYLHDDLVSVMGCSMQMQLCNPNLPETSRCNPLRGIADTTFPRYDLWKDESLKKYIEWADNVLGLGLFSISGIVDALGASALTSRYLLENAIQGPLPDNQWQLEVEHWVGASLTSIQGSFVEAANGPSKNMQSFRVAPNSTEEKQICHNQKIVSTRYSSFSVLGICLILIIGGIIIFLDITLEPFVGFVQKRRSKTRFDPELAHARLEWHANATLQLQRMAHEHAGQGTWSNAAGANPVTLPNEKLAVLDVSDEAHPLLRAPREFNLKKQATASTFKSDKTAVDVNEKLDELTVARQKQLRKDQSEEKHGAVEDRS